MKIVDRKAVRTLMIAFFTMGAFGCHDRGTISDRPPPSTSTSTSMPVLTGAQDCAPYAARVAEILDSASRHSDSFDAPPPELRAHAQAIAAGLAAIGEMPLHAKASVHFKRVRTTLLALAATLDDLADAREGKVQLNLVQLSLQLRDRRGELVDEKGGLSSLCG